MVFRAKMSEPDLLPQLLAADALSAELKNYVRRRLTPAPPMHNAGPDG
jgi:hypothetical protein